MNNSLDSAIRELVIANRVLAYENIVDATGHVSVRHPTDPQRYLLAWSKSPEHVTLDDIMQHSLDGTVVDGDTRPAYKERFIHGAIYDARPDVMAVVHAHPEDVLPFSVTDEPLRALFTAASVIGPKVPVWDIAENFGDETSILVENMEQARDLASCLGKNGLALMAGHGLAAAASSLIEVVRIAVYAARNARVQMAAMHFGKKIRYLSAGEIRVRDSGGYFAADSHGTYRAWEYWAHRSGCADLLPERSAETLRTI